MSRETMPHFGQSHFGELLGRYFNNRLLILSISVGAASLIVRIYCSRLSSIAVSDYRLGFGLLIPLDSFLQYIFTNKRTGNHH